MNNAVFITGTDTGVGKTIAASAITRALKTAGIKVGVMKPVETGCLEVNGRLMPNDGVKLLKAAGIEEDWELITPCRYKYPLAPMVAADMENKPVNMGKILKSYNMLKKKYEFIIVEGAGGLLVPIARYNQNSKQERVLFVSDLIKAMNIPAIIVAKPGLGTINHTLLTINFALENGITILGIIINQATQYFDSLTYKTNYETIKRLSPVPIIATMPYV